jgi:hypothetical protein
MKAGVLLNHGQFFSRQQGAFFLRIHLLFSAEFAWNGYFSSTAIL